MFDNIGPVAEQVATSVSRRRFFGAVGLWAGATAIGLAGFLTGVSARAGRSTASASAFRQTSLAPLLTV